MNVTPSNVGHLLCKYMHDEDNKFGLHVTNLRGDKWISYGDGMLMKECSKVLLTSFCKFLVYIWPRLSKKTFVKLVCD